MSLDPHIDLSRLGHPAMKAAASAADLERRVTALERRTVIQSGTGAPTTAARDGVPYVQNSGTGFMWLRVGGVWRKVALS